MFVNRPTQPIASAAVMLRTPLHRSKRTSLSTNYFAQFPRYRGSRPFAQHTRRFLLPLVSPRPQLPFLHAPAHGSYSRNWKLQLSRLINTDTQRTIRDTTYGGIKVYVVLTVATICIFSVVTGITQSRLERVYPTPPEWRFFTRWAYRDAAAAEDDEGNGSPVDWPEVGPAWRKCLAKLEETSSSDGQGLELIYAIERSEGVVPAWDATKKSEQWRRGYFEVVMGCGRAAERLIGWYQDQTRPSSRPVPGDVMVGPSNLDPRPLPPEQGPAPREENCKPVMEGPERFYLRILGGKGFSRRQKLLAELALADQLDLFGLPMEAERLYRSSLDHACSTLPDPETAVDVNTGIIKGRASEVSENVILASTALAVHYARNGNTKASLPIFLSTLRATREGIPSREATELGPVRHPSLTDTIMDLLKDRPYPPPPPSGDEPPGNPSESCAEASLMAYIGEVLFVTAKTDKDYEHGIAWTRDATDLAESRAGQISRAQARKEQPRTPRQRLLVEGSEGGVEACRKCLEYGLISLQMMFSQMIDREIVSETREGKETEGGASWFGSDPRARTSSGRWEKESESNALRLEKFRDEHIQRMMAGRAGGKPAGFPRIH